MDNVMHIVERSNQRGGRMLSVIDLIQADTMTLEQAGWLVDAITSGASWLVGARPGGAGKTTVMSALLAMLPGDRETFLAGTSGWLTAQKGDTVVAYEIGKGPYEAYVWGRQLRQFCTLIDKGARIVTNLHADTVKQAYNQVVRENDVPERYFNGFEIFLPITMTGNFRHRKRTVKHIRHFRKGRWITPETAELIAETSDATRRFLEECLEKNIHLVENVRNTWLHQRSHHC